ncbi:MAG: hypothetical protein WCU88_06145 [Elusimicrobiota bacterium]|jgi:hypothetical protein
MEEIKKLQARKLLTAELQQLAGTCNIFKKLIVGIRSPTTTRAYYGAQAFFRLFIQLNSMYRVARYYQRRVPDLLDVASLSAIARIVMENAQVLNYLTETGIGQKHFELRMQLMSYQQSAEIRRVWEKFGLPDDHFGSFWHKQGVKNGPVLLKENEVFRLLDTRTQEAMLKGERAYHFPLMKARNGPLSKSLHNALYKLFSNSIHSQPWALDNPVGLESKYVLNSLSIAVLSLSAATTYSAFASLNYMRLRKKVRGLVSSEELNFIQDLARGLRVVNWIESEKRRIREQNKSWASSAH